MALCLLGLANRRVKRCAASEKIQCMRTKIAVTILQHTGIRPSSAAYRKDFDITRHVLRWEDVTLTWDADAKKLSGVLKIHAMKGEARKVYDYTEHKNFTDVGNHRLNLGFALIAWGQLMNVFKETDIARMLEMRNFAVRDECRKWPVLCALDPLAETPMSSTVYLNMVRVLVNGIGINPIPYGPKSFRKGMADQSAAKGQEVAQIILNHKDGSKVTKKFYRSGARVVNLGAVWSGLEPIWGTSLADGMGARRAPEPCLPPPSTELYNFRKEHPEEKKLTIELKTA
ncbi:hypothetical protein HK097_011640 [Rhizophlyctis rosea]|uniref:Uncharacterized protein n=1 Tax=Rhizophlyctis rosea TaxID=64517 RepID=A0AAD5S5Y9_9FUNG|nr:hypothetical protein HK097_011640 [Rhizophlyctis rosea]